MTPGGGPPGADGPSAAWRRPLFSAAAAIFLTWLTLGSSFRQPSGEAALPAIVTEDFNDSAASARARAGRFEGWSIGPSGLDLVPGGRGVLLLDFDLPPGSAAFLFAWVYRPSARISNEVAISWDGNSWRTLGRDVHRLGTPPFALDRPRGASRLSVRITAQDGDPPHASEKLIVDQLEIRIVPTVPPYAHPRVFFLLLALLAAGSFAASGSPSPARVALRYIPAAALLCGLTALWPTALTASWTAFLLDGRSVLALAGVAGGVLLLVARRAVWSRPACTALAFVVLWLAAWSRWLAWQTSATPFAPDAAGLESVASSGAAWYATATREPLFVWLLRAVYALAGAGEPATRFTSVLIGIAFVATVLALGRKLFGACAGLIAGAFLAVHPALAALSIQGLRDELFGLLVGLFLLALLPDGTVTGTGRTAAIAAAMSGIALTRMNALPAAAILLLFFTWRRSWPWTRVVVPLVAAVALLFPYLAYCHARYGDSLYAMNIYATGFRNMEFGGQPGFPSREAVARDLFVGPNTTTFAYIFGLHSFPEVLRFIARGYGRVFFGYWAATPGFFPGASEEIYWIYLAGIPALLFRWKAREGDPFPAFDRRGAELVFSLCVFFGPVAFLARLPAFRLDWRIVSFLAIGYSLAVGRLAAAAIRFLEPAGSSR